MRIKRPVLTFLTLLVALILAVVIVWSYRNGITFKKWFSGDGELIEPVNVQGIVDDFQLWLRDVLWQSADNEGEEKSLALSSSLITGIPANTETSMTVQTKNGTDEQAIAPLDTDIPVDRLAGIPVNTEASVMLTIRKLDDDKRHRAWWTPERGKQDAGSYLPSKVRSSLALWMENGYVYTMIDYTSGYQRGVYFPSSAFENTNYVATLVLKPVHAVATCNFTPQLGPGEQYDALKVSVSANQMITAYIRQDGWIMVEIMTTDGAVRAWLPEECVMLK